MCLDTGFTGFGRKDSFDIRPRRGESFLGFSFLGVITMALDVVVGAGSGAGGEDKATQVEKKKEEMRDELG